MAFSFSFAGDDIDSEGDATDGLSASIDNIKINNDYAVIPPRRHTLKDLLSALPSQLSFNILEVTRSPPLSKSQNPVTNGNQPHPAIQTARIPRRSVFDIRTQLMAEANPEDNDNDTLLAGLEHGDLSSGIYEGGFKTWECAVDLASLLVDYSSLRATSDPRSQRNLHVIELGAGSAVPSLVLLQEALTPQGESSCSRENRRRIHFTLCDYNEDVLRLATAPNVLLAQQVITNAELNGEVDRSDDCEFEDIDENTAVSAMQAFETTSVSFDFVSGGWGDQFVRLITELMPETGAGEDALEILILASETIYSPSSTKIFADVILQILRQSPKTSKAWIAAKRIYFGVGGGVNDFVREITSKGASIRILLEVKDAGVARIVLEVTVAP